MPLPRNIVKPTLPLVPKKTLSARREQLLEYINEDGTYLPKSVLHADLDRGMLDFVKGDLEVITAGKVVPMVDIIITTQNWTQYVETALFVDLDYNPSPPFITVVRNPEVKFGTNPSLQYTIPNRKQFYYASVPTWNGNEQGMDIYTIPQPVPVDINYSVKIICNRMRELNQLNKVVMQKFSSRQAYTFIKGQYVPIIMNNVSDESQMSLESRKYYVQSYDFTMLGYLIDEEEFEVKPAIARVAQVMELDTSTFKKRRNKSPENPDEFLSNFLYVVGNNVLNDVVAYTANLTWLSSDNVESYDVYINGDYYGTDVQKIQITTNDELRIEVIKTDRRFSLVDLRVNTVDMEAKLRAIVRPMPIESLSLTALNKKIKEPWKKDAHHWMILHGRYICKARKALCSECKISDYCNYYKNISAI